MVRAALKRSPPWKKSNPKKRAGTSRKLTPAQKSAARAAAHKAGRRYPNLVDNMRVASKGGKGTKAE
jgi:hypothetical protein